MSRPDQALIYNNLANDLIAAALAKLGVEFSRFIYNDAVGGGAEQLNAEMDKVFEALKVNSVAS